MNAILQSLADAIAIASLVTIAAGILVLAGAIASGHRARLYDAVVLKVLGATRARLAAVYAMEYGILGALAGLTALGAGILAAWAVAKYVIDIPLVVPPAALAFTIVGGAVGHACARVTGRICRARRQTGGAVKKRVSLRPYRWTASAADFRRFAARRPVRFALNLPR